MSRIILICALAGILSVPAKADETLKFRSVQHIASVQTQQVGDVANHMLGVSREPGIAFFPDGSTGTVLKVNTFDGVIGVDGTSTGYFMINFADGSELWLKYTGTVKVSATGKAMHKGTTIAIGGKGQYAGAKGDGTYEGVQSQAIGLPGEVITYIDNVVNIKK
jgi:hypothetical protein